MHALCLLSTEKNHKNSHNLKVASYVLFRDLSEDYSPGDSLSESSEEMFQRGEGGATIYRSFCWKKNIVKHQKITANHKKTDLSS